MPRVTAKQTLAALERDGWQIVRRGKTGHVILRHPVKPGIVPVPMHVGVILKPGTLNSILKQASVTVDEFRRLL